MTKRRTRTKRRTQRRKEKQNFLGIHDVVWQAMIAGLVAVTVAWVETRTKESVDQSTIAIKEEVKAGAEKTTEQAAKTTEEVKKLPEAIENKVGAGAANQ